MECAVINSQQESTWKRGFKEFTLTATNQIYYEAFKAKFDKPNCWANYKVNVGKFMESFGDDIAKCTVKDIENYVNNSGVSRPDNVKAHIRSLLQYIIKNDTMGAANKVSREVLIYLI